LLEAKSGVVGVRERKIVHVQGDTVKKNKYVCFITRAHAALR
jgi:hypothetical protein